MTHSLLSKLDDFTSPDKNMNYVKEPTKYHTGSLSVSKNQFGYHWSYKNGNKKYSISSKPLDTLNSSQIEFLKSYAKNKAKFVLEDKSIMELWLMVDGEYMAIDEDLVNYKDGLHVRIGFNGLTFLPSQEVSVKVEEKKNSWSVVPDSWSIVPYATQTSSEFDDLKLLVQAEKSKFAPKLQEEILISKKPSIPLEQRKLNLKAFIQDFDNQLHKLFKAFPNREINISNDGFITFTMLIEPNSQEDKEHKRIVQERNHAGSKLDTIDGEAMFAYLMNPIYEFLGFDKREDPDRKHYTGMGDSGDFKYGTTRLDIKTRKKVGGRLCNLLVNKGHEDFNMYGLVLREGDATCEGNQRRLSFVGVASQQVVVEKPAQNINGAMKFEVGIHQLSSLRDFILDVLLEVIQKDEI